MIEYGASYMRTVDALEAVVASGVGVGDDKRQVAAEANFLEKSGQIVFAGRLDGYGRGGCTRVCNHRDVGFVARGFCILAEKVMPSKVNNTARLDYKQTDFRIAGQVGRVVVCC